MTYKYKKLRALQGKGSGNGVRGRMGIPFGLNMYENLPFWFEFFTRLNFEVVLSPESSRKLYLKGQRTIPSDTVCYPAKAAPRPCNVPGGAGVDAIFYPCMPIISTRASATTTTTARWWPTTRSCWPPTSLL